MEVIDLKNRQLTKEVSFTASRSSGPGGQNVNKVNTKVEIRFNLQESQLLSDGEKQLVSKKLANKINKEGEIILVSQESRSQYRNKEMLIDKFYLLIAQALIPEKKRIKTRPSKKKNEKRLKRKNIRSEIKQTRSKIRTY